MASLTSNYFKHYLLKKEIDFDSDTFKIILMDPGFVFNRATHSGYADVSGSELNTALGYTVAGATLTGVSVTKDDTNHRGLVTWNNASWTVAGGTLTASAAIIYDDTHANKIVCGYIDFNGNQSTADGGTFTIATISLAIY